MELEFTGATNPKWADASGDYLSCTATFEEYGDEPINITVGREFEPQYPHRSEIFARVEAGEFGPIAAYVLPVLAEADYSDAIQAHLDAKARERQYDSMLTAVTYLASTNAQFAAEATALRDWRDDVWTYGTAQLALVLAGARVAPSIAEFLEELPAFAWPA